MIAPMVRDGKEGVGSMGEDAALACLSDRPRLLFHYFKQLFAQVTNPAIDSILERPVMSLFSTLGEERNLLEETPEHARLLRLERPVITDEELARIRERLAARASRRARCSAVFKAAESGRRSARGARPALPARPARRWRRARTC